MAEIDLVYISRLIDEILNEVRSIREEVRAIKDDIGKITNTRGDNVGEDQTTHRNI